MVGLSLSLLLVVGLVTWRVLDSQPYTAANPVDRSARAQPALAAQTLQRLERAVSERDVAGAESLALAGDESAVALLGALAKNARALRVQDFTLRYVDEAGAVSTDGSWPASVDVTWRFGGFDAAPARAEVRFRFVARGDVVALSSVGGGDLRTPIWLSGPVEVRRTPTTLVVAAATVGRTDAYSARAIAAVPVVGRVFERLAAPAGRRSAR